MKTISLLVTCLLVITCHSFANKTLNLTGRDYQEIPDSFSVDIDQYDEIILDNNLLKTLPEWIKDAKNLKRLSVRNNLFFNVGDLAEKIKDLPIVELNLAGCGIVYIPSEICKMKSIQLLNLRNNQITKIPYLFKELEGLTYLDISNNQLSEIGSTLSYLSNLQHIKIDNNSKLSPHDIMTNLSSVGKLNYLSVDYVDTLSNAWTLPYIHTMIVHCHSQEPFSKYAEGFKTSTLRLVAVNNQLPPFDNLSKNDYLKSFELRNYYSGTIPEDILQLKQITSLDLSNLELTTITHFEKLDHLEYLFLYNNNLNREQVNNIQKKLKNCQVRSNIDQYDAEQDYTIRPPIKEISVPTIKKIIEPQDSSVITGESTTVSIPPNAFLDQKGNTVSDKVTIELKEFNDPISIAFSGINMTAFDEYQNPGTFKSAGMIELNAFDSQSGERLYPNPQNPIEVSIESEQDDDYQLYSYDESDGWEEKDDTLTTTIEPGVNSINLNNINSFIPMIPRSYISKSKIEMNLSKKKEGRFTLNFNNYFKNTSESIIVNDANFIYHYSKPFWSLMRYKFVYNGTDPENDYELLDSISNVIESYKSRTLITTGRKIFNNENNYEYTEDSPLEDIVITYDKQKDDFLISFFCYGKKYSFHFVPEPGQSGSIKNKQKFFETFYQNCLYAEKKNQNNLKEIERVFEKRIKTEEDSFDEMISELSDSLMVSQNRFTSIKNYRYRMRNIGFGLMNLDKINIPSNPERLVADVFDEDNKEMSYSQAIIIDKRNNYVQVLQGGNILINRENEDIGLVFIVNENEIAVASSSEVSKAFRSGKLVTRSFKQKEVNLAKIKSII